MTTKRDKVFVVRTETTASLAKELEKRGFDVEIVEPAHPVFRRLTSRDAQVADLRAHFDHIREKHHPMDDLDMDEGEEP